MSRGKAFLVTKEGLVGGLISAAYDSGYYSGKGEDGQNHHIAARAQRERLRREVLQQIIDKEKAKELAVEGLLTDSGHHKQWFLERILEALGYDLAQIYDELQPDYDWEDGIAP